MNRLLIIAAVAMLACPGLAWAQANQEDPGDQTVQENSNIGTIRDNAPGTWVNAARARHSLLIQARVNNPRMGEPAGTTEGLFGDTGSGATGTLTGLLDLVSQFTGGSSGSLGGLSDILGGLTGGAGTTPSAGGSTPANTGGTSGGTSLADLLALRDQLLGEPSQPAGENKAGNRAQERETRDGGGAIGRLPKIEARAQEQTQERKFLSRWADSMATTVLTALAIGFQSQDFIGFLKDQLRPVFFPANTGSTDDGTNGGGDGSGGGSSGDGGDSSDGGSLEDLNPPDDNSGDDNGSIV